jgi:hypothetical protein
MSFLIISPWIRIQILIQPFVVIVFKIMFNTYYNLHVKVVHHFKHVWNIFPFFNTIVKTLLLHKYKLHILTNQ